MWSDVPELITEEIMNLRSLVVQNARSIDNRLLDVHISAGRFAALDEDLGPVSDVEPIDAEGRLLFPGFVEL